MGLDLPFDDRLPDGATILIAGMGGGFDVYCGLPIYFELRRRGYTVHLASLSFAALKEYQDAEWLSPTLVGVGAPHEGLSGYHPERWLAAWFRECRDETVTIWCFDAAGVVPMAADYRRLVDRLKINAIVLVDGGVDSITRGDEELCGTILEDYLSLAAVSLLSEVPIRIVACIGMGVEGDVSHGLIFENIAALVRGGGMVGTCTLIRDAESSGSYEEAVEYAHSRPGQQPSVINASILSAVRGHFGDYHLTERTKGSELWISPLMSQFWFFDAEAVARANIFIEPLRITNSMGEVFAATYETRDRIALRKPTRVNLP